MADDAPRTDQHGTPIPSDRHSVTAGYTGPVLMQDRYLFEKMAQFNRERVPERVVHAKGSGAHGHFELTRDCSEWTRAAFLTGEQGKKTDVFARFSTVAGEQGSPDTWRDPRGFALKFYTEQGNYDMVGNNTPVFFMSDPLKFSDFIHSQKRDPRTGLRDHNLMWDWWSNWPQSLHQVVWLMGDRGIPKTYRHMNGYSSHTYKWVNASNEAFYVKYHFKTDQGIEFLSDAEAGELAGHEPDAHRRDLFEAIERGNPPSWTLKVQIMPEVEAVDYKFNPFDLTKVWLHSDYEPIEVGTLTLDRNPDNFFAETEQSAFEPGNMVPGIEPSPDKMLQNRLISYADTHRHRIGTNYAHLPINQARCPVNDPQNRDGNMRFDGNHGSRPNYFPNSSDDPRIEDDAEEHEYELTGVVGRNAYDKHSEDDTEYTQAGMFFRMLDDDAQDRLIDNIVSHISDGVDEAIQRRQLEHFRQADETLASRVADGLGLDVPQPAGA
ncbi:MAG: catalase [Solirubrobacterales bacterium]